MKQVKNFIIRNAIRISRHERKRKRIRKYLKFAALPRKIARSRETKFINQPNKVDHVEHIAPTELSLINDPVTVIKYFNSASKILAAKRPIYFRLEEVQIMGPETLAFLCAFIHEEKLTHGTMLRGNSPRAAHLQELFSKAGFYKFVISNVDPNGYGKDKNNEIINRISGYKVEPVTAGEICLSAMKHTFGNENIIGQCIYRVLIECMANTNNHAGDKSKQEMFNWWLLAYKDTDTMITKFCFLDLGMGIFESLEMKHRENKLERLKKMFIPADHKGTLTKIFEGDKTTSTQKKERGLGLQNIYNLVSNDNNIKNFTIISNDIFAQIGYNSEAKITVMSENFVGTMYYWELVP